MVSRRFRWSFDSKRLRLIVSVFLAAMLLVVVEYVHALRAESSMQQAQYARKVTCLYVSELVPSRVLDAKGQPVGSAGRVSLIIHYIKKDEDYFVLRAFGSEYFWECMGEMTEVVKYYSSLELPGFSTEYWCRMDESVPFSRFTRLEERYFTCPKAMTIDEVLDCRPRIAESPIQKRFHFVHEASGEPDQP